MTRLRKRKDSNGKLKDWWAAATCNLIRDRHPEKLKLRTKQYGMGSLSMKEVEAPASQPVA